MTDRKQTLFTIAAAILGLWAVSAVSAAVILATDVFLLSFLGILFAIFLTKTSRLVTAKTGIGYGWALGLTVVTLAAISAGAVFLFGNSIEQRVQQASSHVDDASNNVRDWINGHPMAKSAVADLPFAKRFLQGESSSGRAQKPPEEDGSNPADQQPVMQEDGAQAESKTGHASAAGSNSGLSSSNLGRAAKIVIQVFQAAVATVMNVAIVLFVGLFLATNPGLYRDGAVRLFPQQERDRTRQILNKMSDTLWSWLLGRFASMAITGLGTGIGLAMLGVPMPFVLGGLTGLLTFIPNVGPAIGLAISVLVALPQGGTTAVWVVVVFFVFQVLESYIITPLIQQRQVSIPPAILIVWQVILGILAGFLGVTVSTPLLAVLFVLVRMAYLEDALGEGEAAPA